MTNPVRTETATSWLKLADEQDYEATWNSSSEIFRSAIAMDDWRRSLEAARSPLGAIVSRTMDSVEELDSIDGAPDGKYVRLLFESSFENKKSARETVTLVEESDRQWRTAGYFMK